MTKRRKTAAPADSSATGAVEYRRETERARSAVYLLTLLLLALLPLLFSTSAHRTFVAPKFALLLVVASALIPLLLVALSRRAGIGRDWARPFRSKHVAFVALYFAAVSLSTLLGVAPVSSLFGSFDNSLGLVTQLCFLVCFLAVIVGIGASAARLEVALWVVACTGTVVATYAFAQFFGRDPFLPASVYTFDSAAGPVLRASSSLGHADYLGNFLLYTTPLSAALALASRGSARRLAVIATILSTAAIAFSGTRGAWVGLVAGAAALAALEAGGAGRLFEDKKRAIGSAAAALLIVSICVAAISSSPSSRSIVARARLLAEEGLSSSGRMLLWRDSAQMIPEYALTGCGPEGFRKAFLAYKSEEIARLAPQINNESSHSSYLDSAISHGLAGCMLYVAIITSSLSLLLGARRRAADKKTRLAVTAIFCSIVAVAVHNFFIFDQISTGLYFFAFAALAYCASRVVAAPAILDATLDAPFDAALDPKHGNRTFVARASWAVAIVIGCAIFLSGAWYAFKVVQADVALNKAFASANAGDLNAVIAHGARAAEAPDPAGGYRFALARALALCADRLQISQSGSAPTAAQEGNRAAARDKAIALAAEHAQSSLAYTLTPDSNYLLLAYLAFLKNDTERLRDYSSEALRWDPHYANAHWLRAEAYLAEGNRGEAARHAEAALAINPSLREAQSVLARARGEPLSHSLTAAELIERARSAMDKGNMKKARSLLLRAVRRSSGPCPECHSMLAYVYEASDLRAEAIAEWQKFLKETADDAAAERARSRIESLSAGAPAR